MSGNVGDNVYRASGVIAAAAGGGAVEWCSTVKTGAFCAASGKGYFVNTCGGGVTVTLPATASSGDEINFTDYARTWATGNLTICQNCLNFQGACCPNPVYDTDGATVKIVYSDATKGWIPQLDKDTELETPQTMDVQYMISAGGGGAGYDRGAGGAAGGQRYVATKSFALNFCTTFPITVGDGASGTTSSPPFTAACGDASVFSTITSAGGGYGGKSCEPGGTGGSGGGTGGGTGNPGVNTAGNVPPTPCTQGTPGGGGVAATGYQSGGGGGGGTAGADGTNPGTGGKGGDGKPTAILATPTVPSYGTPGPAPGQYFSGGGGGNGYSCTPGTGGAGGGAAAAATGGGANATVNTGGGGGGDSGSGPGGGGDGAPGIVIIRRLTSDSTSTSGNVVTVCGSDTVHIFTGDGTFVTST